MTRRRNPDEAFRKLVKDAARGSDEAFEKAMVMWIRANGVSPLLKQAFEDSWQGRERKREEGERAVQEAEGVLDRDYQEDVNGVADSLQEAIRDGEVTSSERLQDRLHEEVDGTQRVIYTHQAMLGVVASRNREAAWEEGMAESLDFSDGIPWSQICYFAMQRDVVEELERRDIDVNDPVPEEDEDENEDE